MNEDEKFRPVKSKLFCPVCGKQEVWDSGGAFVERGEYDGDNYEAEGDVPVYKCLACGCIFATDIPDIVSARIHATRDRLETAGYDVTNLSDETLSEINEKWTEEHFEVFSCIGDEDLDKIAAEFGLTRTSPAD